MKQYLVSMPFVAVHDNTLSPFVPQFWANESLAILEENMVMGNLVHRDFEPIIANYGDTVNTRRPGEFTAKRKTTTDNVTVQDASATNVQVPLNQHVHVSFLIRDGEESKSMKNLVDEYMAPAMLAQARFIDQILLGQAYQFLSNLYGNLGGLSSTNAQTYITGVRNVMNKNKAYMMDRNLILTPNSETSLLQNTNFTSANLVGDDGTALREASLGRKMGYDIFMCQNGSSIAVGNTLTSDTTTAIVPAGASTFTVVTGGSGAFVAGEWLTLAGDDIPQQVSAYNSGTKLVTLVGTTKTATISGAAVTKYNGGAVNQSVSPTGYAAGYAKEVTVSGFTVAPQVGQMVSFGTSAVVYTVIQVNGTVGITLDRPLDAAIAHNATVNLGPKGEYNFAFHRNALCLVVRPLAMPRQGTGALSAVVNMNGLSMRATITYDGNKQGHLVTLDMLCGLAILDTKLGAIMCG